MDETRRAVLGATATVALSAVAGSFSVRGQDGHETIEVPGDESTIQDGVDAASEGDLVLVETGTYGEMVDVRTPGVTIRGVDRNGVVLDGEFQRNHGIVIDADGVALENLTARHYTGNAFYWRDVVGFRGSYLTAYNNGYYGIYAYGSRDGRFEHSYASGHPDAGFYLGRNDPFEAVISNVVAEYNTLGYSGTSTGRDLTIRDSVWRHNMAGIVPHTLDTADPPQHSSRIVGNEVYENDNRDAPNTELTYPFLGMGIVVWGGNDNLVADNEVRDHEHFGVVVHEHVDEPSGNVVRDNEVGGSGTADLALGQSVGEGNRFADNEFSSSLPPGIEDGAADGHGRVASVFEEYQDLADSGDFPAGNWREQPEPDDRPTMADPVAPPRPARKDVSWE